jgi:hypothetical protein
VDVVVQEFAQIVANPAVYIQIENLMIILFWNVCIAVFKRQSMLITWTWKNLMQEEWIPK